MTAPDSTWTLTAGVHASMPYAAFLGVRVLQMDPAVVRAELDWSAERCTSGGALHGAALMGLADVCGGLAAFVNLPGGAAGTTTIESKTNFLRAVREGAVEAVARPLHVGRTTIVVQTELTNGQRPVAIVIQTQAVLGR